MVRDQERRTVLKQLGATGLGLGAIGASTETARAEYCIGATEMERGKRYRIDQSHGTADIDDADPLHKGDGTAHAKSDWGIGWLGNDDGLYHFVIVGVFHTYMEHDNGGFSPVDGQDKVRCEWDLWDTSDRSINTFVRSRKHWGRINTYQGHEWWDWYENNKGKVKSKEEVRDKIDTEFQPTTFTETQDFWATPAMQAAGVGIGAASAFISLPALGVGGTAIGAAGLIEGMTDVDYGHTADNDDLEFHPWHDWQLNGAPLTVHATEFQVSIGGSRVALDIEHGYTPLGWDVEAVGAANVGGWRLWIYDDPDPTGPMICERKTRVDPEGPEGETF